MSRFSDKHPVLAVLFVAVVVNAVVGGWVLASYLLGRLLGDYEAVGWLIGLATFVAFLTWLGLRRYSAAKQTARRAHAELDAIAEWADANGWVVQQLGHPGLTDEIERIVLLTDNAGWGHGRTGDQRSAGSDDWAFSGAVARQMPSGRLIVIGGYRYDDRRLWAALQTDTTTSSITWDLVDDARIEQSGTAPALEDGAPVQELLAGAPPITRLRIISNQVLLCQPGRFEADTLTRIAERLTALETRLPHPPGSGPQR